MSMIKRRLDHLERRGRPENTVPTFTMRTNHDMPFVAGYDAAGVLHFTIQIDRRAEADATLVDLEEQHTV